MQKTVDFMSGKSGRVLRMVVGLVVALAAYLWFHGTAAWVLAVVGVVLILSGILKLCILNLLVGRPLNARSDKA